MIVSWFKSFHHRGTETQRKQNPWQTLPLLADSVRASLCASVVKTAQFGLPRDGRFGENGGGDLYLRFALTLSNESGARTFHAQAYIPTQPAQAIEEARLSHAHEDPRRSEGSSTPPRQGA